MLCLAENTAFFLKRAFSEQIFIRVFNVEFHENPVQWKLRPDGPTDMQ